MEAAGRIPPPSKPLKVDRVEKVTYIDNETEFRWELLQDQMVFDKLHEDIKKFAEDGKPLKNVLLKKARGLISVGVLVRCSSTCTKMRRARVY